MARAAEGVAGRSGRDQARSIVIDARAIRASGIGRFLREVLSRLMVDERFGRIKLLGNREELGEFLVALTERTSRLAPDGPGDLR